MPIRKPTIRRAVPRAAHATALDFIRPLSAVRVQQKEDLFRIVTGWQTRNRYVILGADESPVAYIAERDRGFLSTLSRQVFGARRSLEVDLFDVSGHVIASLRRPYFWFLSTLTVYGALGEKVGSVEHRFTVLAPQYDLRGEDGGLFARLKSTILGGETLSDSLVGNRSFNAVSPEGPTGSAITRSWNGILNRALTNEDVYDVSFDSQWTAERRLILLAAVVSIDLDYFEFQKRTLKGALEGGGLFALLGGWSGRGNGDI